MLLMESNNDIFSFQDFERGLMLLGLLTPISFDEVIEKEEAEASKLSISKTKAFTYFKRVVLAAEVINNLREEPTFGRIKFQKMMFICEHVSEMEMANRYSKFAAGPFDNKFMHSINNELHKQKWFSIKKVVQGDFNVFKYFPMENCPKYKDYYLKYFSDFDQQIQFVLELFRYKKTEETELHATVFACALELSQKSANVQLAGLLNIFYSWHDQKKRFPSDKVVGSFYWLQQNGLLPNINIY